jgi:hypothetical protein
MINIDKLIKNLEEAKSRIEANGIGTSYSAHSIAAENRAVKAIEQAITVIKGIYRMGDGN